MLTIEWCTTEPEFFFLALQTSPHSHYSIIVAVFDCWTVICRKPQVEVKLMKLSIVWPPLAPNQTSPMLPLHNPCLWSSLAHLPEWPALPTTSSSVFQGTDGAQSIHKVSRYNSHLQKTCRAVKCYLFIYFFAFSTHVSNMELRVKRTENTERGQSQLPRHKGDAIILYYIQQAKTPIYSINCNVRVSHILTLGKLNGMFA